jgi:hypothetical protein
MKIKNILMIVLCALLISASSLNAQQIIPNFFFGENAWMPDSCGTSKPNGKIASNWDNVKNSNVKLIRYGGAKADGNQPNHYQYFQIIDSIRNRGMEPILQVSFNGVGYDSAAARALVKYINITKGKKIKYWSIGNEPDLYASGTYTNALNISIYIKKFAYAMKNVDTSIRIIGPELSRSSGDPNENLFKVIDTLTSLRSTGTWTANNIMGCIPTGTANGKAAGLPYIDFFSYHMYNFDATGTNSQTWQWCIDRLTAPQKDSARMAWMKTRLDSVNITVTGRSTHKITPVITEAHLCYVTTTVQPTDDQVLNYKASSFYAGQQWAEMMSLALLNGFQWVNFWSVMEGNEMGYMTNVSTPRLKSTYIHMQKMAELFTGTHYRAAEDSAGTGKNIKFIKAFGSKNGCTFAVMVMNQDTSQVKKMYTVNLNNTFQYTNTYSLKFNLSQSKTYTDTIERRSTTVLIFDCGGNISKKYRYTLADSLQGFNAYKAAASPATVYSVSAGANQSICCTGCNVTFTATINPVGGSHTYQWYKNGTAVTTATNSTYAVTGNSSTTNTIQVTLSTAGGLGDPTCTTTATALLIVGSGSSCNGPGHKMLNVASGENPTEIQTSVIQSLVPNPAENQVSVYYTLAGGSNQYEVRIMNLSGQSAAKYRINPETEKLDIDCTNLSSGIYFTSLLENGKVVSTKKLVITK